MARKLDLSTLKSVEVLTDRIAISAALRGAHSKVTGAGQLCTLEERDGELIVRKPVGFAIANKAAKAPAVPDAAALRARLDEIGVPWDDKYAERTIPYFLNDERVDSHGDIVLQNWIFDRFDTNPVMPFSHEWSSDPIGIWPFVELFDRADDDYVGPALWGLGLYATDEVSAFADSIFRLVRARILRMVSVGFFAGKVIDVKDPKEREELGLGQWGYVLDENHLVEASPTTVGANAGAFSLLAAGKSAGLIRAVDVSALRELERRNRVKRVDTSGWAETDPKYCTWAKALFPKHETPDHKGLDVPIDGRVSATPKRAWLGGVAKSKEATPTPIPAPKSEPTTVPVPLELLESILTELRTVRGVIDEVLPSVLATVQDMREGVDALRATASAVSDPLGSKLLAQASDESVLKGGDALKLISDALELIRNQPAKTA